MWLKFVFTILMCTIQEYGIDWNGPPVLSSCEQSVEVPHTEVPLSPVELQQLRDSIDPLADSDDYGIVQYTATREFVQALTWSTTIGS